MKVIYKISIICLIFVILFFQFTYAAHIKVEADVYFTLLFIAIIVAPISYLIKKYIQIILEEKGVVFGYDKISYPILLDDKYIILIYIYKFVSFIFSISLWPIIGLIAMVIVGGLK